MNIARRKRYLVDLPMQLRYLRLVIVPLILCLAALYYLIYYSVFMQMLIPEAIVTTLLPAMRRVNMVAMIACPILFYSIFRMALIYSNRVVGPIPRLEKELDKVVAGDYSVRIHARDKDELKNFIGKINTLIEKLDSGRSAS